MIQDGIINLNKPAGMTSHDCVGRMRRLTGIRRIGHTGTLDPQAIGVLPICIGSATRITEYLDLDLKSYRCSMVLGLVTDTQDIWGQVLSDKRGELSGTFDEKTIRQAFEGFSGIIEQIPPKYSAIRVDGRRLYEYARAGESVEIKPRTVYLKELLIEDINLEELTITFTVTCSKGTYIRSICSDVGEKLSCGGAMSALCRTGSGIFDLASAVGFETLEQEREDLSRFLLPVDYPLVHFGKAVLNQERGRWFVNGGHIRFSEVSILEEPEYMEKDFTLPAREEYRGAYNLYVKEEEGDRFLGVAFYNNTYKKLVADKVFARC